MREDGYYVRFGRHGTLSLIDEIERRDIEIDHLRKALGTANEAHAFALEERNRARRLCVEMRNKIVELGEKP